MVQQKILSVHPIILSYCRYVIYCPLTLFLRQSRNDSPGLKISMDGERTTQHTTSSMVMLILPRILVVRQRCSSKLAHTSLGCHQPHLCWLGQAVLFPSHLQLTPPPWIPPPSSFYPVLCLFATPCQVPPSLPLHLDPPAFPSLHWIPPSPLCLVLPSLPPRLMNSSLISPLSERAVVVISSPPLV